MNRGAHRILVEKIDEEVLKRMPEWFRAIRDAYRTKANRFIPR